MRRLVAYILSCVTIFLGIGASFKPVATSINCDLSYREGKKMTFQLYNHDDEALPISDDAAKEYADVMDARLKAFGTSDYTINTNGKDTITITLTGRGETEYSYISKLLTTNPIYTLTTTAKSSDDQKKKKEIYDDEGLWNTTTAYLAYDGNSTIVVKPVPTKYKTEITGELFTAAKEIEKKEGNAEPEAPKYSIVLWMNKKENETYDLKDKEPIKSKIIYDQFNTSNFFYDKEQNSFQIRFTPKANTDSEIRAAYDEGLFFMNLLNCSRTEYDCRNIYIDPISPTVENLLIYGEHINIALSATSISLLIGFAIIVGLLIFFYKMGALAIVATSATTSMLTLFIFTLFKPLFNVSALVGLTIVFLASVGIGILHNTYFKEEVYKGRSMKKANFEAGKKTTLLTIDLSVLLVITGVLVYFIGGKTVGSLGIAFIIGGIVNLFINTLLLKGLMWLITNNTSTQKSYKLFNIKQRYVPDLSKEERPNFVSPFNKSKIVNKHKIPSIIFATLTLASMVAMITFTSIKSNMYNYSPYYSNSNEIHINIEYEKTVPPTTIDELTSKVFDKIKKNGNQINYDKSIYNFTYTVDRIVSISEILTTRYYDYTITINESNLDDEVYTYVGEEESEKGSLESIVRIGLEKASIASGSAVNVESRKVSLYSVPSNSGLIITASLVSIVTCSLYLWIRRYRASRILPLALITALGTTISAGILAITRIPATPIAAIGSVMTALISMLIGLFILNKDKDLIRDERLKDVATRKVTLNKALMLGLIPLTVLGGAASIVLLINFASSARYFASIFFAGAVGIISSSVMFMTMFLPMSNFLDERFSRINLPEIKIRKKKKVKEKSNEPEEAIFIGIND